MKALIPSHRENKRYLKIVGKNLKKNVPESIKEFVGILGLSECSLNWINSEKESAIISINRESLEKVRASFCIFSERIVVEKVSGTLKGLKK